MKQELLHEREPDYQLEEERRAEEAHRRLLQGAAEAAADYAAAIAARPVHAETGADSSSAVARAAAAVGGVVTVAPVQGVPVAGTNNVATTFELPSAKLGQLLGHKGLTIQRVKELSGVSRLHILDKEFAKTQKTVHVEVSGSSESVSIAVALMQKVIAGDQSDLGFASYYIAVEPALIGKLMGRRGASVKEMSEVTNCYIEIQQYPEQGVVDGQPRVFFAGPQDRVDTAVDLCTRFIAAPGARLDAVLNGGDVIVAQAGASAASGSDATAVNRLVAAVAGSSRAPPPPRSASASSGGLNESLLGALARASAAAPARAGQAAEAEPAPYPAWAVSGDEPLALSSDATDALAMHGGDEEGGEPVEARIVNLPARFKSHLLGLKGQTIELIRTVSGVSRCHIQEKGDVGRTGTIHVELVGAQSQVEACEKLIQGIVYGDHSGIGHLTQYINIDPTVVGKMMGKQGGTVRELTELTGCYIEIQQYPEQGVYDGQPRLFLAGPPESVEWATNIVERFILAPGGKLSSVLRPDELARRPQPGAGTMVVLQPDQLDETQLQLVPEQTLLQEQPVLQDPEQLAYEPQLVQAYEQPTLLLQAGGQAALPAPQPLPRRSAAEQDALVAHNMAALARAAQAASQQLSTSRLSSPGSLAPAPVAPGSESMTAILTQLAEVTGGSPPPAPRYAVEQQHDASGPVTVAIPLPATATTVKSSNVISNSLEERVLEIPGGKRAHLLGLKGQTIETVRQKSGVKKCHIMDKSTPGNKHANVSIQILGDPSSVETCSGMISGIVAGDHSSIGHTTDFVPLDLGKVTAVMGPKGQTVTMLKDLTSCYLDIQQGPQPGVPSGTARIFMAGPPDNVYRARTVLEAFLGALDQIPSSGDAASEGLQVLQQVAQQLAAV